MSKGCKCKSIAASGVWACPPRELLLVVSSEAIFEPKQPLEKFFSVAIAD